jgi:hypothetical protein
MSSVDLHTHSTASDGTLSPAELVRKAKDIGLRALALTDHDTAGGLEEASRAGKGCGLEVIPGCELSIDYSRGQMHLLGLWLPVRPERLNDTLSRLRELRHSRNERILAKLAQLGINIDYGEVKELAGDASIGRPHIARLLMEKNIVGSINEAFAEFIGPHGKAYVPKDKLGPEKAIEVLKDEQATVLLAHPYSLELAPQELEAELQRLKGLGLDGLEAYYPEHSADETALYIELASRLDLLVSGGTDFHGSVKPDIELGRGRGGLDLPYSLVEGLKLARKAQGLPCG